MASRAREITRQAASGIDEYGLAGMIKRYGIGGVFLALAYALINGISTFGDTVLAPFRALADGLEKLVEAVVGSPVSILDQTAEFTGYTLTQGEWGFFGPLTYAVGVLAVMAGLYVFTITLRKLELRPWVLFRGGRR